MPFNPNSDRDLARLRAAIEDSDRELKPFRENRREAVRSYAGMQYGSGASEDKVPVNMIEQMVGVFSRHLAANNPRVLATTFMPNLKPQAAGLQLKVNKRIRQIELVETLRECVVDAIFCVGIAKVGIGPDSIVQLGDVPMTIGDSFVECVSLDDFILDMSADKVRKADFMANRYQLDEYDLRDPIYNPSVVEKMRPLRDRGQYGDNAERTDQIARQGGYIETINDRYQVLDVWLPQSRLIVTLPEESGAPPLRVMEWQGPENGPFYLLGFGKVPDKLMPLAPAMIATDLSDFITLMLNKVFRQAVRQKTIGLYIGDSEEDANTTTSAVDGTMNRVDTLDSTRFVRFPGADPQSLNTGLQARKLFSELMGNLELLGGIGAQSPTATQDEMLSRQANKRISDMQDHFMGFVKKIVNALAFYEWQDPLGEDQLPKRVQGTDIIVPSVFSPEMRQGSFPEFDIEIEPYSMQDYSPSTRIRSIMEIYQNFILPSQEFIVSQGGTVKLKKLLKLLARYADLPEIEDIVEFSGTPDADSTQRRRTESAQRPNITQRTNTRINRGSGAEPDYMSEILAASAQTPEEF